MAGNEIVGRRSAATIRYMNEPYAGLLPQQLHGEVANAAGSNGCITHGTGLGFCYRNNVGQRFERLARIRREHVRRGTNSCTGSRSFSVSNGRLGRTKGLVA